MPYIQLKCHLVQNLLFEHTQRPDSSTMTTKMVSKKSRMVIFTAVNVRAVKYLDLWICKTYRHCCRSVLRHNDRYRLVGYCDDRANSQHSSQGRARRSGASHHTEDLLRPTAGSRSLSSRVQCRRTTNKNRGISAVVIFTSRFSLSLPSHGG